jgi:hypothetical protein
MEDIFPPLFHLPLPFVGEEIKVRGHKRTILSRIRVQKKYAKTK